MNANHLQRLIKELFLFFITYCIHLASQTNKASTDMTQQLLQNKALQV